jgi:hypothetical protein
MMTMCDGGEIPTLQKNIDVDGDLMLELAIAVQIKPPNNLVSGMKVLQVQVLAEQHWLSNHAVAYKAETLAFY